jgi:hypothetical protein
MPTSLHDYSVRPRPVFEIADQDQRLAVADQAAVGGMDARGEIDQLLVGAQAVIVTVAVKRLVRIGHRG